MAARAPEHGVARFEIWVWLWARLRPYLSRVAVIMLALVLDVVFVTLFPLGIRVLIDNAVVPGNGQVLLITLSALVGLFAASTVLSVVGDRLTATVAVRAVSDTRDALYSHLQELSPGFFERFTQGELISRFTSDCAALEGAIARGLPTIFAYGLQVAVSVALLFVLEWRLALVTLISLPLTLVGPELLGPRATRASYVRKSDEARVTGSVQEAISAQVVVRAFGLEQQLRDRLGEQIMVLIRSASHALYLSAILARSTNVAVTVVELLIVGAGALLLYQGSLTTGSLVAFIGLVLNVDSAVSHLSQALPEWLHAPASVQRIQELVQEQPQVDDAPGAAKLPRAASCVSFEGVSFGYSPGNAVVRDLSVEIPVGRSTAIVGPSGSGKSTLLTLLARFYDPDRGVVKIDGSDLRTVTQSSLRGQMGIVFQESFLFSTTVRENIRMGRPEASNDEVAAAAAAAQVHDAILALPAGYETEVGERGGRLSGGQRQRVALARAIVRQPSILLLDEPTAALDPATEAALNITLEQLSHGRTVISVTHRLASVVNADHILVIHDGQLVQQGSHDQLLELEGMYRQLWEQQAGFVVSGDGQHADVTPARLKAIPLLEELDADLLSELATHFVTERYPAGRVIVEEGEPGDKFCILVRGSVEVSRLDAAGQPRHVAVLEQGDFFGEIALLSDVRRTATVRARTPSIILALARDQFLKLAASSPSLRGAIEQVAERRRRELLAVIT